MIAAVVLLALPAEPPVDIGREAAAEEARRELAKGAYDRTASTWIGRALEALINWIIDVLNEVAVRAPGGRGGIAILAGLIALIVVVVVWRAGVLRTTRRARGAVFGGDEPVLPAQLYRADAERAATAGDYAAAVRARFRACAAELAERTVIDDRAGRTAHEVVDDAGAAVPALRDRLAPSAEVFDLVVYGGRTATAEHYATVSAADEAARTVSTRSLIIGAAR